MSVKAKLIDLYGDKQFGFRPKSSTLNAHLEIQDFITRTIDSEACVGIAMVAFDLSKAFDRIPHFQLLKTLNLECFPDKFITWLRSYLSQRTQRVIFQGTLSSNEIAVTSGVPQGSVLAPFLFAAHVGSLRAVHDQTVLIKYADDFTLLIPHYRSKTSLFTSQLNDEISNIKSWCLKQHLVINDSKTKSVFFGKQSPTENIERFLPNEVDEQKILGITFHKSMKWDSHIENIVKAAGKRIYVLKYLRRTNSVSKKDLLMVYNSYILGALNYNCELFVGINKKNNERIESIRRRCHRIICGPHCGCDDFPTVKEKREMLAMKTFEKMMEKSNISHKLLPHLLPRSKRFFQEHIKTKRRADSFIPFCVMRYNSSKK